MEFALHTLLKVKRIRYTRVHISKNMRAVLVRVREIVYVSAVASETSSMHACMHMCLCLFGRCCYCFCLSINVQSSYVRAQDYMRIFNWHSLVFVFVPHGAQI